jgi:hypothetical protein
METVEFVLPCQRSRFRETYDSWRKLRAVRCQASRFHTSVWCREFQFQFKWRVFVNISKKMRLKSRWEELRNSSDCNQTEGVFWHTEILILSIFDFLISTHQIALRTAVWRTRWRPKPAVLISSFPFLYHQVRPLNRRSTSNRDDTCSSMASTSMPSFPKARSCQHFYSQTNQKSVIR